MTGSMTFSVPPEIIEAIAERAAEIAIEQVRSEFALMVEISPYMTVQEAAEFLRCSRQRVDDLLSQRRLTRLKEGARTLILREEVQAYVREER